MDVVCERRLQIIEQQIGEIIKGGTYTENRIISTDKHLQRIDARIGVVERGISVAVHQIDGLVEKIATLKRGEPPTEGDRLAHLIGTDTQVKKLAKDMRGGYSAMEEIERHILMLEAKIDVFYGEDQVTMDTLIANIDDLRDDMKHLYDMKIADSQKQIAALDRRTEGMYGLVGRINAQSDAMVVLQRQVDHINDQALPSVTCDLDEGTKSVEQIMCDLYVYKSQLASVNTTVDVYSDVLLGLQQQIDQINTHKLPIITCDLGVLQGRVMAVEHTTAGIPTIVSHINTMRQQINDLHDAIPAPDDIIDEINDRIENMTVVLVDDLDEPAPIMNPIDERIDELEDHIEDAKGEIGALMECKQIADTIEARRQVS